MYYPPPLHKSSKRITVNNSLSPEFNSYFNHSTIIYRQLFIYSLRQNQIKSNQIKKLLSPYLSPTPLSHFISSSFFRLDFSLWCHTIPYRIIHSSNLGLGPGPQPGLFFIDRRMDGWIDSHLAIRYLGIQLDSHLIHISSLLPPYLSPIFCFSTNSFFILFYRIIKVPPHHPSPSPSHFPPSKTSIPRFISFSKISVPTTPPLTSPSPFPSPPPPPLPNPYLTSPEIR